MRRVSGAYGWILVALVVLFWDGLAVRFRRVETLSSAHARAVQSRRGRMIVTLVTAMFVSHLHRWPTVFRRVDPISAVARWLGGE